MHMRFVALLALVSAIACAHRREAPPVDVSPPTTHVIDVPPITEGVIEPPGVAHIMRGLYFLHHGHPSAAIPHFRLALIYDADSAYLHEKLAEAWLDEGRLDKASEVLERGLQFVPKDPHLSTIAGELARRNADFAMAVKRFDAGLADENTVSLAGPGAIDSLLWTNDRAGADRTSASLASTFSDDDELAVQVGSAYEDHGLLDAALVQYRRARGVRPASREAAIGEMRVLEMLGKPADAANALVELFAFEPDEIPLYTQVMRLFFRAGSMSAEAYKTEALRIAGDEPTGRIVIASGVVAEGKLEQGVSIIREAQLGGDDEARKLAVHAFIAETYMRGGEPERCLHELPTPVPIPEILRTRAACLGALGKTHDALLSLAQARSAGGRPRELAFDAARIAASEDDEVRARRELDAFLRATMIDQYGATLARASFAQHLGRENEAAGLISALYGSTQPDLDLRLRWADALARTDRLDESLTLLRTLVPEQPEDPTRLNALGFTLVEANRSLDEAEVYLRHAYRLASDETFIVDSLGWLLHVRGKDALAETMLERAAKGSPTDPEILMHLGEVYKARGKRDAAHALFAKATHLQPSRPLKTKLERLLREKA